MSRKTIIIIIALLLVIIAAVLIYFFFFREGAPLEPVGPPGAFPDIPSVPGRISRPVIEQTGKLPDNFYTGIPKGQIQRVFALSTEPIIGLALNPDADKVRYFLEANGNVVEVGFEGESPTKIVSTIVKGIREISWSNDRGRVAVLLDDSTRNFSYDFESGLSFDLAPGVTTVGFSPDDERIAFYQNDVYSALNRFALSNLDGSDLEEIFRTGLARWRLAWSKINELLISQPPSGIIQSFLLRLNPDTGKVGKVLANQYGLEFKPSPDGFKILVSRTDEFGHNLMLEVYDTQTQQFTVLAGGTIAAKCSWAPDNVHVFCGIPTDYSRNQFWPDDYYKGVIRTSDELVKINTETTASQIIFSPSIFDVETPVVDPLENYFMFINRKDGIGYSVKF
jgi:Tol biopolymer transport system component